MVRSPQNYVEFEPKGMWKINWSCVVILDLQALNAGPLLPPRLMCFLRCQGI